MYTIATYDYECTRKCRLHGDEINGAITKRSVSDEALARYMAKLCRNFVDITDEMGRSALAMAVSVGNRCRLVQWLLQNGANINLKDKESSHPPIVRAITHGHVVEAVLLMAKGASISPDLDFINPFQQCHRVKKEVENEYRCEAFVWGKNKNYNLGVGTVQSKEAPESLETFRKNRIWIDQVSMSSYHSLFLTDTGHVYATGHGKGGRLGSGDELTLVTPKKIKIPRREESEKIVCVAAGRNHSLALSNKNRVYVTGSNTHSQLGLKQTEMTLTFTEIPMNFSEAKRVIASDYCSYVVTETEVYGFGTNLGQLAVKKERDKFVTPRKLPFNTEKGKIQIAECTNAALVCYTENPTAFLHVVYNYQSKVHKKPLMEPFRSISVTGGLIPDGSKDIIKCDKPLRFIVLTDLSNIFIWSETNEKFVRCCIEAIRYLAIDRLIWCKDDILFSYFGNLYHGTATEVHFKASQAGASEYQETYTLKELSVSRRYKIKIKRVPYVDKVYDFCTDPEGDNFAALLENPRKFFSVPDFIEKPYNYGNLYEFDTIHDLTLEIGGRTFHAHKIIIFARSEYLKKVILADETEVVALTELQTLGLTAELFELILRFLYTNNPIMKNEIERLTADYHQTLTMLKKVLTVMGLPELITSLKKNSEKCGKPFKPIQREDYPDLYDVTIKLDGNREIKAHKCILIARLDYFNMMFTHSWTETDTVNLTTISLDYMLPLIDFLYSNNIEEIRNTNYSDSFLYNMITICDQFFVEDLKLIFELIVSEKLYVRNCGEILEFAHTYNCETLQNCCLQFIALNFARVLEHRTLEGVDIDALLPINKFYRQFFGLEATRTITPYSTAISDEDLMEFIKDFSIDFTVATTTAEPSDEMKMSASTSLRKVKSKPSRALLDKRNYEKEGILSIKESLNDAVATTASAVDTKKPEPEVEPPKSWLKVNEKKDVVKKKSILAGIKANEVLKSEPKPAFEFVSLNTSRQTTSPPLEAAEADRKLATTFSLADITPMKRSGNRKRTTSWDQISAIPVPIIVSPPSNPWNTVPPVETVKSPFEELPVPRQRRSNRSISFDTPNSSFSSIVESEKREKKYIEKIKTKSLVLTQMEEKAIEELHEFYNVAATFDETITIERRQYGVKFTGTWYN